MGVVTPRAPMGSGTPKIWLQPPLNSKEALITERANGVGHREEPARNVCTSGRMSCNKIEWSQFIRQAMRDKKFIAHSSPKSTRSKVCEYSAKVSATEKLKKLKSEEQWEHDGADV